MKPRQKIHLGMTMIDMITVMSEGNPGAINVMAQLVKDDPLGMIMILDLDDMGMRGSQIWIAYKNGCGQDMEKFKEFCRNRDKTIVDLVNNHAGHDCPQAATHGKS